MTNDPPLTNDQGMSKSESPIRSYGHWSFGIGQSPVIGESLRNWSFARTSPRLAPSLSFSRHHVAEIPMPSAIRCRNLKKTYPGRPPVEAVCGLDLDVQVGECFGLLGPNGAGKTTTMEILEGILDATEGEVEVLGMHWDREAAAIRKRIGISLQETRLADKLTVREVITLFRSFYPSGLEPDEAIRRVSMEEKARSYVSK